LVAGAASEPEVAQLSILELGLASILSQLLTTPKLVGTNSLKILKTSITCDSEVSYSAGMHSILSKSVAVAQRPYSFSLALV
jgi:hypothetical protein